MDGNLIGVNVSEPGKGSSRLWVIALLLISAVIFLANSAALPLMDPDESRCASIVRDMFRSGDWLMPRLEGQLYWDKPAPFFWLAAAGQWATGSVELGGRLVGALAAITCVLTTFGFARRYTGNFGAFLAAMILAGSPEFVFIGRWYRMDMPFIAAMWAALWWFWRYEASTSSQENPLRAKVWQQWLGFYAFAALATLMKGPAGLVLPVMVVMVYFLLSQPRRILGFFNPIGIIAFISIIGPFYITICHYYPEYPQKFLFDQNVGRFADSSFKHHTLYSIGYVGVLMLGMIPWSVYLPGVIGRGVVQAWRQRKDRSHLSFLWVAALLPFLFFCLSKVQLPNYIAPCFPPLAVLIGLQLAKWAESNQKDKLFNTGARVLCVIMVVVLLAVVIAKGCCAALLQDDDLLDKSPVKMLTNLAQAVSGSLNWQILATVFGVMTIIAVMAWQLGRGFRRSFLLSGIAANGVILLAIFYFVFPDFYNVLSFRDMGIAARAAANGEPNLCTWGEHMFSLAFYADTDYCQKVSSHKSDTVESLENLRAAMTGMPNAFCLLNDPRKIAQLEMLSGRKVQVIKQKGHYYLVRLAKPE